MNQSLIKSSGHREEVWTNERCYITELMNDPAVPEVSLARCRVPPGTTTQLHKLGVKEWYVIGDGRGLMELNSAAPFEIRPGDTVAIPAGTSQRVTNTGDSDLHFECVCIPRLTLKCYEPLEGD